MESVICGDGPMGRAAAEELREVGWAVRVLGRPEGGLHRPAAFVGASVMVDFSTGTAVRDNVHAALKAGLRCLVIGTTGWSGSAADVERDLIDAGAAAVVAPNFSPGALILARLVREAATSLAAVGGYDPWVVEWHRASKRDRPSGTALGLADQVVAGGLRTGFATSFEGPRGGDAFEVHGVRAGSSPGMHLVGFDAPGEVLELRLSARDRRCYAVGARMAVEWLGCDGRSPGFHEFASVIEDSNHQRRIP